MKIRGVNKGTAARAILQRLTVMYGHRPDFVLCIGDDRSDETMFAAVNDIYHRDLELKAIARGAAKEEK